MVDKCANPDCKTPFRYFRDGKLFAAHRPVKKKASSDSPGIAVEFFWLCESCCARMTLVFDDPIGAPLISPKIEVEIEEAQLQEDLLSVA